MPNLIPLEKAREIVLAHTSALPTEEVGLLDAVGRVAATDLASDIDVSPFAAASMDGFAVRASQLESASAETPVELDVTAEIAAGDSYEGEFSDTQCVRIMTGAPIPNCADAVVKYEIVNVVSGDGKPGSTVAFAAPTQDGANVRKPGEEAKAGETIVHAGEVVREAGAGFLASCGITRVPTYRRPRVGVMATGSELVDPTEIPGPGKIRNSNAYALAACAAQAGGLPTILPIVEDDYEKIAAAVKGAAHEYDCVLTTGGAANGDFDFIEQVVEELGDVFFTGVNLRPGKAQTFGLVDGVPVFGLPGNPAAAYMGFQLLTRPALRKMQGYSHLEFLEVTAELTCDIRAKKDARMTMMRGAIEKLGQGRYAATPFSKQSSGLFGPLQKSNALIRIPRGDVGHAAGSEVDCLVLDVSEEIVL